ncbi:hypothetical protein [Rhodococcus sp. H29-C3]|uniref:hypothetical protein n=1 Tax=Rhodococcus sp. H29-C3 TaxID=3046307 RepID=UPI0024B8D29E|nr:hypothetical protein [Rhodococcus sp. H29-C3]MDJ0363018.1 hypothetical protein [Rhodococcus sp. H29-C3]
MGERESVEVAGVSERVLDELAHTLTERLDILLDRLTDRALAVPDAGTAAWHRHWRGRDSESGRQHHARRLYVRAVLASRAGIGLTHRLCLLHPSPVYLPRSAPPPGVDASTPTNWSFSSPSRCEGGDRRLHVGIDREGLIETPQYQGPAGGGPVRDDGETTELADALDWLWPARSCQGGHVGEIDDDRGGSRLGQLRCRREIDFTAAARNARSQSRCAVIFNRLPPHMS